MRICVTHFSNQLKEPDMTLLSGSVIIIIQAPYMYNAQVAGSQHARGALKALPDGQAQARAPLVYLLQRWGGEGGGGEFGRWFQFFQTLGFYKRHQAQERQWLQYT